MTRLALGMVVTLALALAGTAHAKDARAPRAASGGPPLDERLSPQLQPSLKAFEDAWNRHDPDGMAALFADDAVLVNPSGRVARGRAEITQLFEDEHQRGMMKGTRFSHRLIGAREIAPGLAFVDEDVTLSGARAPDGQALPDQRLRGALLVARQQDGRWQVIEGRPYVLAPAGAPAGLATAPPAARMGGTGSGAASEEPTRSSSVGDTPAILNGQTTPHDGP